MSSNDRKMVVFDLDETLGQFVEVGMFWDALKYVTDMTENESDFFRVMDVFPEFLRPKIMDILEHLVDMRKKNICQSVMYILITRVEKLGKTNASYFDHKLQYRLFDHIIAAFKVRVK